MTRPSRKPGAATAAPGSRGASTHAPFDALVNEHRDALWRYALRRTASREDAADVVADTLLVAWRRRAALPPDDPLPWLYGVARHVLSTQRRSAARRAALTDRLMTRLPTQHARDHAEALAERDLVHAALATLRERDRELLLLVAWEGLDPDRAAVALGCRPATLHVRLHRARGRLAASLERLGAAPDVSIADAGAAR